MWRDYSTRYGDIEARMICNRYLELQSKTKSPEELQFCGELHTAMQYDLQMKRNAPGQKESILAMLKRAKEIKNEYAAGNSLAKKRPHGMEL